MTLPPDFDELVEGRIYKSIIAGADFPFNHRNNDVNALFDLDPPFRRLLIDDHPEDKGTLLPFGGIELEWEHGPDPQRRVAFRFALGFFRSRLQPLASSWFRKTVFTSVISPTNPRSSSPADARRTLSRPASSPQIPTAVPSCWLIRATMSLLVLPASTICTTSIMASSV